MKPMTDKAIIEKHDTSVRHRARIELKLVNALIRRAKEFKYDFFIYEEDTIDSLVATSPKEFKTELFNLDDATLIVIREDNIQMGWIKLVFGNDGYDLISDYTTNLEDFLKPINEYADKLEERGY